ncbi:50S ribosomal protein L29 [Candidatus Berkelbacteria bacterium]|nr:50S ribosomal protein L29 [Candidatus Berkelbacteria bacterium]
MKRKDELSGLRSLTEQKLSGKIVEEQKRLTTLMQQKALGSLKNVREISSVKKSIARIHTVLDQKLAEKIKESK